MGKKKSSSEAEACSVGDIFAIPLGKQSFVFARIINIQDGWDLAELFDFTAKTAQFNDKIKESNVLYPPFPFGIDDIEKGYLKIVSRDDKYKPKYIKDLLFVTGTKGSYRIIKVNQFKPGEKIADADAEKLPRMEYYALEGMISRVKDILADGKKNISAK